MTQQLVNALALGSVYTLFALGLTLCWGTLNLLNLAHGALFTAGAFAAYLVSDSLAIIPLPLAVIVAACSGALLAALMQLCVFGPVQRRARDQTEAGLHILIASVVMGAGIVGVAEVIGNHQAVSVDGAYVEVTSFVIGEVRVSNIQAIMLLSALLLTGLLSWYTRRSQAGRALRAIATDKRAAELVGIPVTGLQVWALAVSGALAGVAGVLMSVYLGVADPHVGDALLLKAFAAIIIAGVGSLEGAVLFSFILAILETMVASWAGAEARDAIAFGLILLVLLIRPQGVFARADGIRA